MQKKLILLLILLIIPANSLNSEELQQNKDNLDVYNDMLIGEILPTGKVYLELFSRSGGFDNFQRFNDLDYQRKLKIYPIEKMDITYFDATFAEIIKGKYIGGIEADSKYFSNPFSKPIQDALLYLTNEKPSKVSTCISFNKSQVNKVIYFFDNDKRPYSREEYKTAMKYIEDVNERIKKAGGPLAPLTKDYTILNATKKMLISIENIECDILLSIYVTHGFEYVTTVYVIDFILNGEINLTKVKCNYDGPY
jgi:hypothetical protein